ncbi:MAG: hypothetical protein GX786_01920 [Clostridiales bacterium]|nr:hypothetical protein [Clostridiales bacterium]
MKKKRLWFLFLLLFLLAVFGVFLWPKTPPSSAPPSPSSPPALSISQEDISLSLPAVQYKLAPKAFATENLAPYLSDTRNPSAHISLNPYGNLVIQTPEKTYLSPSDFNIADLHHLSSTYDAQISQVRQALTAIGWTPAQAPHCFLSARQVHQIFSQAFLPFVPTFEAFLEEKAIPENLADTTYFCCFAQTVAGVPLARDFFQGSDNQFSPTYALLWVDEKGKIISGTIHPPYTVLQQAPLSLSLLSQEEGKAALLRAIEEIDGTYTDFYQENHLSLSYEISALFPCLIVDNNLLALPGWHGLEHTTYTHTQTGDQTHSYWDTAIYGFPDG